MPYKIISWNVNSLVIRKEHLYYLIENEKPDFIFLQETRLGGREIHIEGYYNYFCGSSGRNGVAILSLFPLNKIEEHSDRYMEYKFLDLHLVCVYIPNGGSIFSPVEAKINMINSISQKNWQNVILAGDWNVLYHPLEITCTNPYSMEEIDCLKNMEKNFSFCVPTKTYLTWWHYRNNNFTKNIGMGLDKFYWKNIIVNKIRILKLYRTLERPSDHAPIAMEFEMKN